MKINGLFIATVLIGSQLTFAQQVTVSNSAMKAITSCSLSEKSIIPVSKAGLNDNKNRFRKWVGASIDIDNSAKRESNRFNRTTYKTVSDNAQSRFLTERFNPSGEIIVVNKVAFQKKSEPSPTLYREGPMYFKFAQMKENKALTKLKSDDIIPIVKGFITDNKFITETDIDKIGSVELCDTRINEDGKKNVDGTDFVVNQNVILRRMVDGKPVVNSHFSISVYPDTKEILEMDCFNWPSLEENSRATLSKEALATANALSEAELSNKINTRIMNVVKNCKKVYVNEVTQGWFQSDSDLSPVLIVDFEAITGNNSEPDKYMEVVTLTGNDEIFNKDYRKDYKPAAMPLEDQ